LAWVCSWCDHDRGTAFVMWLAELITQRGIARHESVDLRQRRRRMPSGGHAVWSEGGPAKFFVILAVSIALLCSSSSWTTDNDESR